MTYRDILVHLEGTDADGPRARFAAKLAVQHDALLIGLHVTPPWSLPPYMAMAVDAGLVEAQQAQLKAQADAAGEHFKAAVDAEGARAEWRSVDGDPARETCRHARYCDLTVTGQADPEDIASADSLVIESLLLDSGRPLLIVPFIGIQRPALSTVLVAWNGSREATRAVNDALPLLAMADRVDVLVCGPDKSEAATAGIPAADIAQHLARHRVNAVAQHLPAEDLSVGDALLSRADDLGSELLVMGGYGHSRIRELLLGGVTRHILKHMTIPVLMAH